MQCVNDAATVCGIQCPGWCFFADVQIGLDGTYFICNSGTTHDGDGNEDDQSQDHQEDYVSESPTSAKADARETVRRLSQ